jgi:hypothetical protein
MLDKQVGTSKLDTKNMLMTLSPTKINLDMPLHILQENHEYDPIDKIMYILKLQGKGKHLDVYERFHIYKANKQKSVMNEQRVEVNNVLFDVITD